MSTVQPRPGPRCGWPEKCSLPDSAHTPPQGTRRVWGFHDVQCQVPNPHPGDHLDGYQVCSLINDHGGECDYRRHAAEPAAVAA